MVKNITDYGAFVDLGGIDGLLHVTDIAWRRVNHPSEVLTIGETVKVQIIRINHETHRISLGMKQLQADPWEGIEAKYPVGAKFTGRVTNITDYGAFVELEPGIEGLIHVSEMSWTKKNVHPGKIVSTSQEVEVMVLEVDPDKRRISLGLKQTLRNPWEAFAEKHPVGSTVEGEVKNKTEFGLFIGLDGDVDGMVHLSDLDWKQAGRAGARRVQPRRHGQGQGARRRRREGAHLARHQAARRRSVVTAETAGDLKKGAVVTGTVTEVNDGGIEVKIADSELTAFIKRSDLAATATTSGRSASPTARRSTRASPSSIARPARSRSRSRRWKSPRRRKRSRNTARRYRALRSATSSAPRSSARARRKTTRKKRRRAGLDLLDVTCATQMAGLVPAILVLPGPHAPPTTSIVMRGLDPRIHCYGRAASRAWQAHASLAAAWIAGPSPGNDGWKVKRRQCAARPPA